MLVLGILSDTHGLLRPEVAAALSAVDLILHAGDVGSEEVLSRLQAIAPVIAVRGNVDTQPWARALPITADVEVQGMNFFLVHNIAVLRQHPAPAGTNVVIYGHSHKLSQTEAESICYLNPGSAGPRRFSLPVSLVLAHWEDHRWRFSFRDLTGQS